MTDTAELRRLEAAAHPAPWIRLWQSTTVRWIGGDDALQDQGSIDLCVAARNQLPGLLDEVEQLRKAAREVLRCESKWRAAMNGLGHPGREHDQAIRQSRFISSQVDDCSACGGAQYGADDELSTAYADLREALGEPRHFYEWDVYRAALTADPRAEGGQG